MKQITRYEFLELIQQQPDFKLSFDNLMKELNINNPKEVAYLISNLDLIDFVDTNPSMSELFLENWFDMSDNDRAAIYLELTHKGYDIYINEKFAKKIILEKQLNERTSLRYSKLALIISITSLIFSLFLQWFF